MNASDRNHRGKLFIEGKYAGPVCFSYSSGSSSPMDTDDELRSEEIGTIKMMLCKGIVIPSRIEDNLSLRTFHVTSYSHDYRKRETTLTVTSVHQ